MVAYESPAVLSLFVWTLRICENNVLGDGNSDMAEGKPMTFFCAVGAVGP